MRSPHFLGTAKVSIIREITKLSYLCTVKIENMDLGDRPVVLAPMEDVTDASFRILCREAGAAMVTTEFVPSDGLIRDASKSIAKMRTLEEESPVAIQIYGHIPESMVDAARMADRLVITSDNCRTEDPEAILADIRAGLDWEGLAKSLFITDRREAIRTAILTAPEGATLLLAGKGHEDYQIIGTTKTHFDEKEIVAETFKLIL